MIISNKNGLRKQRRLADATGEGQTRGGVRSAREDAFRSRALISSRDRGVSARHDHRSAPLSPLVTMDQVAIKRTLQELIKREDLKNKICVDCGNPNPQWASVSFAIFICLQVSGARV